MSEKDTQLVRGAIADALHFHRGDRTVERLCELAETLATNHEFLVARIQYAIALTEGRKP